MLTVQILLDSRATVDGLSRCLRSLGECFPSWWCRVLFGDLGASEDVLELVSDYTVVPVSDAKGLDVCRNGLSSYSTTDWQLWMESWEVLSDGDSVIDRVNCGGGNLEFTVVCGDSVSRQTRLWRGCGFVNPVFERVEVSGEKSSCLILAEGVKSHPRELRLAEEWVGRSGTSPDPYYHRSCAYLGLGRVDEFLRDADRYLFMETNPSASVPVTMTRYYTALVYCYAKKDASESVRRLAPCLISKPLMAEFWCLLGDVHYHLISRFDKAACFYENALVLGGRRLSDDPFPMEISKYDEYPSKMLENCREIVGGSKRIGLVEVID